MLVSGKAIASAIKVIFWHNTDATYIIHWRAMNCMHYQCLAALPFHITRNSHHNRNLYACPFCSCPESGTRHAVCGPKDSMPHCFCIQERMQTGCGAPLCVLEAFPAMYNKFASSRRLQSAVSWGEKHAGQYTNVRSPAHSITLGPQTSISRLSSILQRL